MVVELAKGSVEEVKIKGHELCLKLNATLQGAKCVYLSFFDEVEFTKWLRKFKKVSFQPWLHKTSYRFIFLLIPVGEGFL